MTWATHVCDVDRVAVELTVNGWGDVPRLGHCDRTAAVAHMRSRGVSLRIMAERMKLPQRTIERIIARKAM